MPKYRFLLPTLKGGRQYQVGDVEELPKEYGEVLAHWGVVEKVKEEEKPKKAASKKGEK